MAVYSATFSAKTVAAAQDLFEILAPTTSRVIIREFRLGQYSDYGDAASEILSVQIIRGYETPGTGGDLVIPVNLMSVPGRLSAYSTVYANNTTLAADGSPETIISDTFNIAAGWWYYPPQEERAAIYPLHRLVCRISAPADALTMNGTMIFEEIGYMPP